MNEEASVDPSPRIPLMLHCLRNTELESVQYPQYSCRGVAELPALVHPAQWHPRANFRPNSGNYGNAVSTLRNCRVYTMQFPRGNQMGGKTDCLNSSPNLRTYPRPNSPQVISSRENLRVT